MAESVEFRGFNVDIGEKKNMILEQQNLNIYTIFVC